MSIPVKPESLYVPASVTALYNDVACYAIESGKRVRIRFDLGHKEGNVLGGAMANNLSDEHSLSLYVDEKEEAEETEAPAEDAEGEDADDGDEE